MTTEERIRGKSQVEDSIAFASLPDNIVVIRVTGRGSFHNSMELRNLVDTLAARPGCEGLRYILDLAHCVTMDSTFMGVLASIGLRQLRNSGEKLTVLNANDQNIRLLSTLGLTQFLNVRAADVETSQLSDSEFQEILKEDSSRRDRIIHMIEAHRDLCSIDPSNNMRFESVLKYLNESLKQETDD